MGILLSLLIGAAVVVIFGSVMIFLVESGHPNSQIDSWLDAVWWTVATVTTVGYGDIVPVTDVGRVIAIFYMFFGVTVLGIALSVLATNYYKKRFEGEKEISHAQKLILDKIEALEKTKRKSKKTLEH